MNAETETPQAEVAEIWPRDGAVRIIGDLLADAASGSGRWYLLAVLRDTDTSKSYELRVEDGRFDVSVPVTEFGTAGEGPAREGVKWDLYCAPEDRLEESAEKWLRLGRHLDDIADKKKVMVFPAQTSAESGAGVTVRPFYTVNNNLSVECLPSPSDKENP
ncbi:hypothetical protein [Streptomonospora wellingtoniae]|uniref:Uncharacterized protein n=1 Tax=Streptomonospora wellingtoniae TaxID=3075544 RepID=A0ABU2KXP5_9ACTN|nr:hypothetical protein [Streptomonospora sp. DSM 45055]MDT0304066.1 hypothetical protein [Streptomonospora sp. DSM 45055]